MILLKRGKAVCVIWLKEMPQIMDKFSVVKVCVDGFIFMKWYSYVRLGNT